MPRWPNNYCCSICKNNFNIGNVITITPFDIDTQYLISLFLNRKLNQDLTSKIINILNVPCYAHRNCYYLHFPKPNYKAYWSLCDKNYMYLSNQYHSIH
jgi:hypothetical protein